MDAREHRSGRCGVAVGERTLQSRVERPPAAVVGAFIEVAVDDGDRQFRLEAGTVEDGVQRAVLELRDRAFEHLAQLVSRAFDLVEQGHGEGVPASLASHGALAGAGAGLRMGAALELAVPQRARQLALDAARFDGDAAQLLVEQFARVEVARAAGLALGGASAKACCSGCSICARQPGPK